MTFQVTMALTEELVTDMLRLWPEVSPNTWRLANKAWADLGGVRALPQALRRNPPALLEGQHPRVFENLRSAAVYGNTR